VSADAFRSLFDGLAPIGRRTAGGYERSAWTDADVQCRAWFTDEAQRRGLTVDEDRNGNVWAWWLPGGAATELQDAFVTGSHLDSVTGGGAYDGPLGIISALAAIDDLRSRGVTPRKPVAVVAFSDEEGSRFGRACVGSSLLTGRLDPAEARGLRDADGVSLADAMRHAGRDPDALGRDDESLRRIGMFVELHIEQGRALADREAPIGVASSIWPHGRWHVRIDGEGNHAGTTRLADRRDPMVTLAAVVLAAREHAERHGALATIGRVIVEPNTSNAVPASVSAWLDARSEDDESLQSLVAAVGLVATEEAAREGTSIAISCASLTAGVEFSPDLRGRLLRILGDVPVIATGAGHDAGVLASHVPAAMLFVRNPTGVSHSPAESAQEDDCLVGVAALARVMESWVG
jgi:beta-ureidopropionase / N-carbamoyl-L-amino-acid hydrolase